MSVHVPMSSSEVPGAQRESAPRPAAWPALVALGAALVALGTVVVAATTPHSDGRLWASIVGYALGAVVVTVLVSVHKSKDNRSRQHREFRPRPLWDTVLRVALVLGLLAAAGDAYLLATEVSKW